MTSPIKLTPQEMDMLLKDIALQIEYVEDNLDDYPIYDTDIQNLSDPIREILEKGGYM